MPRPLRSLHHSLRLLLAAAAVLLFVWLLARLWIEWQWFSQFGLAGVLGRRWALQLIGAAAGLAGCCGLQLWLRDLWRLPRQGVRRMPLAPGPYAAALLLLVLGQTLPGLVLLRLARRLLADPFQSTPLVGVLAAPPGQLLPLLLLALLAAVALVWRPLAAARLLVALASVAATTCLARGWGLWSLALAAPVAGVREPVLGADVSFGLVRFPALVLALSLSAAVLGVALSGGLWGLMARAPQLSDGRFGGFSPPQLRALRRPLALLALLVAGAFWLGRHHYVRRPPSGPN